MRYGRSKTGGGLAAGAMTDALLSLSICLGEGAVVELGAGEGALTGGGGSIGALVTYEVCENDGRGPMTGSGSGARSSSPSCEVSMVISLVGTGPVRWL